MTSGTIVSWLKNVGDKVEAGDPSWCRADKADGGRSFDEGYVASILVDEGSEADVGAVVALLAPDEAVRNGGLGQRVAAARRRQHRRGPGARSRARRLIFIVGLGRDARRDDRHTEGRRRRRTSTWRPSRTGQFERVTEADVEPALGIAAQEG